jgi:TfoX/Sxy family transcriptional regulator of competence genes
MAPDVVYDEALAARVRAVLGSQPDVGETKMFGGLSFMLGGQLCCGVLKDRLVVRIGVDQLHQALSEPHTRPMDFTGRPSSGMVYVDATGLGSDRELGRWVQRAVEYVRTHPRAAKRQRRRRVV